ncbi:Med24 [Columba guinea]|nr:Med24 [Columba guinea]
MKVVNLKQAILQAWKERWSDYQWAINMKKFFPRGATWDILNLAEALLEQAMIGPSPNPLILSYLKYAISSQMVSYSTVLTAISKFDDFSRDLCVQSLLEIMDMFCDRLSCHGKAEECIGLCRALMSALNWLLRCAAFYAEKVKETLEQAAAESQLKMCLERLEKMLSSTKNRALIHIAKLEETSSWSTVEQSLVKLGENLSSLSNSPLRSQADDCISLIKSIPTMLSVHSEQLNKTGFPTVHAVVLLEGTMNLTGETQLLVEQLMMVKRMQRIPSPLFILEIWKACFVGLIESPEGTEELKWTAFTFLKIPQVLVKLKKYPQGEKDFTEDVNSAFEFLLKLTPLLDKADQRCKQADREHAPHLKSAENANIQPNPGLILRAEPTVTNILKSLDLLLAAAAATGKLKSFARKFIKLNEFTKHITGEGSKGAPVRALLFDISFLMLCHVAQTYGSEVILSESSPAGEVPFFETWMLTCMPEEGKILNPDHPCFRPDSTKVEQMKWHEACLSISAAILEILNAWENGVLTFESIQKITDNIKGKVCSMVVCAVAWLVAHVRMLGLDEREKSLQMIRQLATPLHSENTLQFYNERVVIMSSILEHMCADVLQQTATQIKFPSTGMDTIPYWNLLPPKKPIKEELLKETRKEHTLRAVELLYAIFCLDMQQLTLTLLGHILPSLLTDSSKWHTLMDPPGKALAKLSVWCALSSYSSHNKGQASARQKKRHREDIEDYISLFPLDDTQPSKLMRLLSSNEEDANILSSPNRSMSTSLSASQLHTVSMRDPLNRTAGTHTQFVQWFMEECVDCLEQGSRGSILQFMPFTMVSELVKVSTMSSPRIILAITDLSLPLGRRVAAKAIAAL